LKDFKSLTNCRMRKEGSVKGTERRGRGRGRDSLLILYGP